MKFTALIVVFVSALMSGCLSVLPETIDALAKDPATACIQLTLSTPWGTQVTKLARSVCRNCQVQCAPDGSMAVHAIEPPKGPTF